MQTTFGITAPSVRYMPRNANACKIRGRARLCPVARLKNNEIALADTIVVNAAMKTSVWVNASTSVAAPFPIRTERTTLWHYTETHLHCKITFQ